jgi:branched-subunit amino acid aminotransferase/4-amino-4-deoxychorismate lyase
MNYSWYNGKIDLTENTRINTDDLGFLRGYGLFDYFRTYNGKPFQWDWYWERFNNSAKLLRIPLSLKKREAEVILKELFALSKLDEVAFRFLLTGGNAPDSSTMTAPNLLVRAENVPVLSSELFERGISIITENYTRDIPEIKSTDYKRLLSLQSVLQEKEAKDVLYHTKGQLTEMSRSNIFLVKNGIIKTPKKGILKGITRRTVLELAKPDFEVLETNIQLGEIFEADEVFTTSTNKKVMSIIKIDDIMIGGGLTGEVSKILLSRFNALAGSW